MRRSFFYGAGDPQLTERYRKRGDPLHRRRNGVHGIEEGEPLVCQVETAGIEPPAQKPLPVFPVLGDTRLLLPGDLCCCQGRQLPFPAAARGKNSPMDTG